MARRSRRRTRREYQKITRRHAKRSTLLGLLSDLNSPYKNNRTRQVASKKRNRARINRDGFLNRVRESRMRERQRKKNALRPLSSPSFTLTTQKNKISICKSRGVRAEVLHALNKTGKSGQKKPVRRNPDVICRRK